MCAALCNCEDVLDNRYGKIAKQEREELTPWICGFEFVFHGVLYQCKQRYEENDGLVKR